MARPNECFAQPMTSYALSSSNPICLPRFGSKHCTPQTISLISVPPEPLTTPHRIFDYLTSIPHTPISEFLVVCVFQISMPQHTQTSASLYTLRFPRISTGTQRFSVP
jgi:hypothetical protein